MKKCKFCKDLETLIEKLNESGFITEQAGNYLKITIARFPDFREKIKIGTPEEILKQAEKIYEKYDAKKNADEIFKLHGGNIFAIRYECERFRIVLAPMPAIIEAWVMEEE